MENESIYNLIQKENCIEKKSLLNKGGLNHQKQQHVIGSTFGIRITDCSNCSDCSDHYNFFCFYYFYHFYAFIAV